MSIYKITDTKVFCGCPSGHAYVANIEDGLLTPDGVSAPKCPECGRQSFLTCCGDVPKDAGNFERHVLNQSYAKILFSNNHFLGEFSSDDIDEGIFILAREATESEPVEAKIHSAIRTSILGNGCKFVDGEFVKDVE